MSGTTSSLLSNRIYLLLLVIVFFMHLASFLVIPIFPVFLQKIRAFSVGQVGIVLGVGSAFYQAGSLLGGMLSDRFGRRNVMVAGAITQGLAMLGYRYSETYLLYLLFSAVNGLGVGLLAPTLKAMIADVVPALQRTAAFSWRGIFAHSGIILAGISITLLTTTASQRLFLYAAFVFLLVALVTRFSLPYDRCTGEHCRRTPISEYKKILLHRSFLLYSAITLFIWAFYAQFALVMPLRGESVLGSEKLVGLIWTITSLTVVLLQGTISRFLLQRVNPYIALATGTFMLGAGLFSLGWSERFITLSASAILFIIGEMLFLPVLDSLVGHFAKAEWLGAYFGFSNFVSGIGTAIGTSLGGGMVERLGGVGSKAPWIVYGVTTILIAALVGLFALYAMPRHQQGMHRKPFLLRRREKAK
jgi:MFS family permease